MKASANFGTVCPIRNLHNYLDITCFLNIPISMVIEMKKGERSFLVEDKKTG